MITTTALLSLDGITSKKIVNASQTIPAEVPAFSQPNKNILIILYDSHAFYINVTLKEYLYLFLFNNNRHNDGYEFKNFSLCPEYKKKHNKEKCLEYGSSSFSITIENNNSIFDLKKTIFKEISVPDNNVNVEESQLESNTPDGLMTVENEIKITMQKVDNTFYRVQDNNI
ncbi:7164_t:CDS:2 [Funneliformis mosseae]|uniref:7164_t:CDS:1 n=1 Tax=Funneliformis mosseae TaxID=27381 RepID=A0A9N9HGL4_FUNMO|nr:7164_t:CDS:2 [Funneliformis mosseae]